MSTVAYVAMPEAHRAVLRAFLHAAASGLPVDPAQPRRASASVRAALASAPSWYAADPARAQAADRLTEQFSRAVGACLFADETAVRSQASA